MQSDAADRTQISKNPLDNKLFNYNKGYDLIVYKKLI